MKQKHLIGIDLGTSYSSLSCLDSNLEARSVANKEGEFKTPSAVFFSNSGGGLIVGSNALAPGYNNPKQFITHAKRHMGNRNIFWEVDGVFYSPVDVAAFVLRKLVRDAEAELGPIEQAVITVPAHFNDYQRKMTIQAGERAGLKAVPLLNEPVAAALGFALGSGGREMLYLHNACTVLIYDLGGGTFDLSLVRLDKTQLRVLATAGHLMLGGLDWDQRLIERFIHSFKVMHAVDLADSKNHKSLRRLSREIENAKRRLSDPAISETELFFQHAGLETEYRISRREFEAETTDLVDQTRVLVEDLVKAAGVPWAEIDAIIPVGGSTRMPMISRLIERFALRGPRVYQLSPDFAVSSGAALYAGMLEESRGLRSRAPAQRAEALAGFRTEVVSSRTIGILVRDKHGEQVVQPLIPRNTPLPVAARLTVTTNRPGQSRASLKIVEAVGTNGGHLPLCVCRINDLPLELPVRSAIDVELTCDSQELLHVIAVHRATGRLATITAQYDDAASRDGSDEVVAAAGSRHAVGMSRGDET